MNGIDRVKAEHKAMERLMQNRASFGAADTEPDTLYQWLIAKQLERIQGGDGKGVVVPRTAKAWQLYYTRGCGKVGQELGKQTTKVCSAIRYAVSNGEWVEVCEWARGICWRVGINWVE